uniref:Uncharacterized protein n=1 Tax=Anguilla anguilla TaxID=7936 RepID=A0A0E9VJV0_ANGAN
MHKMSLWKTMLSMCLSPNTMVECPQALCIHLF